MSEWTMRTLGSVCIKIGSGATPTGGQESYKEDGISLIRSQNVDDFVFLYDGLAHIDDEQAQKLNNVIVEAKDTLINITGDSVARVCSAPFNVIPARVNQHVAIIRADGIQLDNYFAKYSLLAMKEYLLSISEIGATRRALTKGMLENLEILIPNIEEQRAIAEVLSSIDDKIDLLTRQNATLEALAQTYFRQWFVEETKDGLPNKWEFIDLEEVATLIPGGDRPSNFSAEKTNIYKVPIYSNGVTNEGLYGFTDTPRIFEESITVSARGTIGYVCLRTVPYVPIVRLISVIPNQRLISGKYLYLWLKNQDINGTGTTQEQLTIPDFRKTQILVPHFDIMNYFTSVVNPMFLKIERNKAQIQTLQKLRDTLLPKLISGEMTVRL